MSNIYYEIINGAIATTVSMLLYYYVVGIVISSWSFIILYLVDCILNCKDIILLLFLT